MGLALDGGRDGVDWSSGWIIKIIQLQFASLRSLLTHTFSKVRLRYHDWLILWWVWLAVSRCFDKNMFVLKTLFIISNTRVWCFNISMFSNYKLKLLSAFKASQKTEKLKRSLGYTSLYGHLVFFWSGVTAKIFPIYHAIDILS